MGTNIVIIEGHMGADPVLNTTNTNQVPVCNIRVATNRKWTNNQNQLVEDVQWHNVVCWDKIASTVAQFMRKGSHVIVQGRLQTREFMGGTTYENGQPVVDGAGNPIMVKRYTTEIVASSVGFLDKKPQAVAYPQPGVAGNIQPVVAGAPAFVAPVAVAPGTAFVAPPVIAADPNAVQAAFIQPAPNPATTTVQPVVVPSPVGV